MDTAVQKNPLTDGSDYCRPFGQHNINQCLTVKEVSKMFKVSMWSIYQMIKHCPDFPYVNVGLTKRYLIDPEKFHQWHNERTRKRQQKINSHLPSADELLGVY